MSLNITISNEINGEVYGPIELNHDMALSDLLALLQIDCHYNGAKHDLYVNSTLIDPQQQNDKTLKDLNFKDDDLLLLRPKFNATSTAATAASHDDDDDTFLSLFRNELLRNETLRNQFAANVPNLQQLLDNEQQFKQQLGPLLLQQRHQQQANPFGIPQQEYQTLMTNPDHPANAKRIAELIDQQAIDEQLRNALEYTPEVFFPVPMLYVNLEINGSPVKAFVDSGSQITIMSKSLAEKSGLTKLIDKRYAGEARGVGRGEIIGKIHQAQVKIETQFVPCSFTVLDLDIDMLLGLDMLRRHQGCIDLEKNVLRFAGVETRFLNESEIPKSEIFEQKLEPTKPTPTSSIPKPSPGAVAKPVPKTATATATVPTATATTAPHTTQRTFPEPLIKQVTDLGLSLIHI